MADNPTAVGFNPDDPDDSILLPDHLIRTLYHLGDLMLVQSAPRERQPLMLRYMLSRLKGVAQRYVGYIESQLAAHGEDAVLTRPRIWELAKALDAAASGRRDVSTPLTFLYVCALEGLLDEPQRAIDLDAAEFTVRYLTTGMTLAQLGGQTHKTSSTVSSLISESIGQLWDALPPDASERFPFDRTADFPLWALRRVRLLKSGI